jgi:hypothetical protein
VKNEVQVARVRTSELIQVPGRKEKYWHQMYDDRSAAFLVVGYGATRRIESSESIDLAARQKTRLLRYQRVAGLFEEHMTMVPLTAWLP